MKSNHRTLFAWRKTCAVLVSLVVLAGCAASPPETASRAGSWVQDQAADAYVFGYPLVLMTTARDTAIGAGPGQESLNALRHARALPSPGALNPAFPSLDTLASSGWLDVGAEPVVLTLPNFGGRYADARVLDMWTNVVWSADTPGPSRVTGLKAQTIAFVGPGWQGTLPRSVTRVEVPTRYLWANVRVQANGPRDIAAVRGLQRAMRVEPLSVYLGQQRAFSAVARSDRPDTAVSLPDTPAAQLAALPAGAFFGRLAEALGDNPPATADAHALQGLAEIGVKPGAPLRMPTGARLSQIERGVATGRERVATAPSNLMTDKGWSWLGDGVGQYGTDYALRAFAASTQPGIGTLRDELRAWVRTDSRGQPLNGAKRYVVRFAPGQLPPVRGFWSLTAYTPDGALGQGAQRSVSGGERHGARRNADGSLEVVLSASRVKAANWLPVPRGAFELVLRLYAPQLEALGGAEGDGWQPPAVVPQAQRRAKRK
ncbi:DUF1254 domain-containing protein [Paraburkholderia hayleyella]|uniref:DUF1254 domain-containing protein n=1 Tax=Paraburkholderia hayleyella TaxID=2152889 RepID=UPI0012923B7E|nr:DUF1254 domain-containing protein [Paraburkholderia hayleyella]